MFGSTVNVAAHSPFASGVAVNAATTPTSGDPTTVPSTDGAEPLIDGVRIGIKVEEVKSSPLKAAPNGFEPTSPEARAAIEAIVLDSYGWFKGLVKDRRKMDDSQLTQVSDGRVFTGRQAVGLKLVDSLGNEKAALAWLEKEKKVPANTPVRDYSLQPRFSELSFLHVAAWTFETLGLNVVAQRIEEWGAVQAVERLNLDGLLALWHPPSSN